jgi:hypothetical protein
MNSSKSGPSDASRGPNAESPGPTVASLDQAPNTKRWSENSRGAESSFVVMQLELVVGILQQSWPWEAGTHPFRNEQVGGGRNLRSVRTVVAAGRAGAHTELAVAVDGKRVVVDRLLLAPVAAAWGYTALAEAVGTLADDFETKSSSHD